MYTISVIIPIYNSAQYLRTCVESVLSQEMPDMQILLVDDGSTDTSARICDEYAAADPRVEVLHKANEGYGRAVNRGIGLAKGKYISIVESDDYILPGMYQTLFQAAEENRLDVVYADYYRFWYDGVERFSDPEGLVYNTVLEDDRREKMFDFPVCNWTGLFRRAFLEENGIRHNESPGASYQDTGFFLQVMSTCSRMMCLDRAFYMYRQDNPNSSMKCGDKLYASREEYDFAADFLRKRGLRRQEAICAYHRMWAYYCTYFRVYDRLKPEFVDMVIAEYKKYKPLIPAAYFSSKQTVLDWMEGLEAHRDKIARTAERMAALRAELERGNIVICGSAGAAAQGVRAMRELDCFTGILYVVCPEAEAPGTVENIPVKGMDALPRFDKGAVYLLCDEAGTACAEEMRKALEELKCERIIPLQTLRELLADMAIVFLPAVEGWPPDPPAMDEGEPITGNPIVNQWEDSKMEQQDERLIRRIDNLARYAVNEEKKIYIRGTKNAGLMLGAYFETKGTPFCGYVDADESKQGTTLLEKYPCIPPEQLPRDAYVFVTAKSAAVQREIGVELQDMHIPYADQLQDCTEALIELLDDELYLKILFPALVDYPLNLEDPRTICEKIQWLKLYDRNPLYTKLVDKYEVKKFVAGRIGEKYIIPAYGVWDRFDEIDFDRLPDQFILKCTHDSGTSFAVTDKSSFDKEAARAVLEPRLRRNYFYRTREWAYKDVKPRIIAEKYIPSLSKPDSIEYKTSCFDGKVGFVTICTGIPHSTFEAWTNDHYDVNFNHMPWWTKHQNAKQRPEKPAQWDELISICEKLSEGIPYVRVDSYIIDGQIYFGELTFYTWAGFMKFNPPEWDRMLGDYIRLPEKRT